MKMKEKKSPQKEIESPQDTEFTEQIKNLQYRLNKAVDKLQIDEAEKIRNQINKLKYDHELTKGQSYTQLLEDRCIIIESKNNIRIQQIINDFHKQNIQKRKSFAEQFQNLRSTHIAELKNMENDFYKQIFPISFQKCPDAEILFAKAKNAAREGDFQAARQYNKDGQTEETNFRKRKENLIKKEHEAIFTKLLNKQTTQLNSLSQNLSIALSTIKQSQKIKLQEQRKLYINELNIAYGQTMTALTRDKSISIDNKMNVQNELKQKFIEIKLKNQIISKEEAQTLDMNKTFSTTSGDSCVFSSSKVSPSSRDTKRSNSESKDNHIKELKSSFEEQSKNELTTSDNDSYNETEVFEQNFKENEEMNEFLSEKTFQEEE